MYEIYHAFQGVEIDKLYLKSRNDMIMVKKVEVEKVDIIYTCDSCEKNIHNIAFTC